ncbi:MAG TPA: site-specific DNA-methyltransferase [Anaerovoracaceae bacterium]|nr:site-specific DNA-methyltransferase [Anaerovoracaceae bacterium]
MKTSIKLENKDSLIGMKGMKSECVDLVLSDPPYGIANKTKLTKVGDKFVTTEQAWGNDFKDEWKGIEDYYVWFKPYVAEMARVLKEDGSLVLFLDRTYTGYLIHHLMEDFGLKYRNKVYFQKTNPLPSLRKNNYRSSIEEAIWLTKGKSYHINFAEQSEMTQCYEGAIGKKASAHPTEKYRWMMEPLIKNHSKPGDLILDPFAGSGSTLVYGHELGRNVVGFELNEKFYQMAMERLSGKAKKAA